MTNDNIYHGASLGQRD